MDAIVRSILTAPTTDLGALVTRVGELLVAAGVPVWRLNIAQLAMHPEVLVQRGFGDAVLAIFPVSGDPTDACARALQAARDAIDALARWNTERETPLAMGVALHIGEVFYGNVGGPDRLDFTVIGAAVNEACRLEPLCKTLGAPVVMSAAFRNHVQGDDIVDLGEHALRGVGVPAKVFGLR